MNESESYRYSSYEYEVMSDEENGAMDGRNRLSTVVAGVACCC